MAGVHNISFARLLIELENRGMNIAPWGPLAIGAHVAKKFMMTRVVTQMFRGRVTAYRVDRRRNEDIYDILYEDGDKKTMNSKQFSEAYATALANPPLPPGETVPGLNQGLENDETRLRALLISRLQEEEELERLTLYAQDKRFRSDVTKTKHELGRVVVDMLHCPMRMNEKILFLLYYAVMKRCGGDMSGMKSVLDRLSEKVRLIGDLPDAWSHTFAKKKKDKKVKLLPFKMPLSESKNIFNLKQLAGLYELIDIAIGSGDPKVPTSIQIAADNNKMWRDFIDSYLALLDMILDSRDFTEDDYKEIDKRGKKMYRLLVAGFGIEGCTNYFHYVGSGHIVWLMRNSGNLWRLRNEGVEAFNNIMSLRHNKHNGHGGGKRTREGEPKETCEEFWSLGQFLGRWSMWHLGYADLLDPDYKGPLPTHNILERIGECMVIPNENIDMNAHEELQCQECLVSSDNETETDNSYEPNNVDDDALVLLDDLAWTEEDNSRDSTLSDVFTPCTPLTMSMTDARAQGMYKRRCMEKSS